MVEDYQNSTEFDARLLAEYKEGMRDMKAGFATSNPTMTGVDWSFVLEVFGETAVEEGEAQLEAEEGEVIGGARAVEDVVILDKPEARDD